jgi:TonB family protein
MIKKLILSTFILLPILFTNCASITQGKSQIVTVDTPYCPGATCRLTNSDGTYFITKTPGTVSINKARSALDVTCYKGDERSSSGADSSLDNMTWGNILIGGIIGAGVDMITGAAYKYPTLITHPLDCKDEDSNSSKDNKNSKIQELQKQLDELKEQENLNNKVQNNYSGNEIGSKEKPFTEPQNIEEGRQLRILIPDYSRELRSRELEGTVVIKFDIDKSGSVRNAFVLESSGHVELDSISLEAVKQYIFETSTLNGKPKSILGKKKKFTFSLED